MNIEASIDERQDMVALNGKVLEMGSPNYKMHRAAEIKRVSVNGTKIFPPLVIGYRYR